MGDNEHAWVAWIHLHRKEEENQESMEETLSSYHSNSMEINLDTIWFSNETVKSWTSVCLLDLYYKLHSQQIKPLLSSSWSRLVNRLMKWRHVPGAGGHLTRCSTKRKFHSLTTIMDVLQSARLFPLLCYITHRCDVQLARTVALLVEITLLDFTVQNQSALVN